MSKTPGQKFPTFECIISHTMEDYDSDVEYFFILKNRLASEIALLRVGDNDWAVNYDRILVYLKALAESIVNVSDPPDHQFLVKLSLNEELEDDVIDRLLRSESITTAQLVAASQTVREIMFWYIRTSKNSKFSISFNPERFQGLPYLRLALVYRSVNLSNRT